MVQDERAMKGNAVTPSESTTKRRQHEIEIAKARENRRASHADRWYAPNAWPKNALPIMEWLLLVLA
jgi:hypothetical protein